MIPRGRLSFTLGGLLLAATLILSGLAPAGEETAAVKKARELVEKHKDAVVLVEVVVNIKVSRGGRSQDGERKLEVNGTVIGADGLTVISSTSIDPAAAYRRMGMKADVTPTSVKIVLADGTEHEAKVVLTDKELDLAFVKPKEKIKLAHVELKKSAAPGLLDEMVSITRLGRKANREPGVALSRVMSIIRKPRLRYVPSGQMFMACPVFTASGEVLGLALRQQDGSSSVLPCQDILEAAEQVLADGEKTGEKKPAEAGPETKAAPAEEKKPAASSGTKPGSGAKGE